MKKTIVLTPVAERDVAFYIRTASALKALGETVVFLSLYQPGNARIKASGFKVYDPYPFFPKNSQSLPSPHELEEKFAIPGLSNFLLHEKLTFGIETDAQVIRHFSQLLMACEQTFILLEKENPGDEYILIQELAGFVGPLALFFVSMSRNWKHFFSEPGFFKGHIHFLKNSLYLKIPERQVSNEISKKVDQYLTTSFQNKVIVAASKDAHHYKDMGLAKVFNSMNFKNLSMKLIYKYVFRHQFIFSHISNHVFRYLGMLKNRFLNGSSYTQLSDIPEGKKLIYFPFHVQLDFSLTIRSPLWLDQLGLIEKVLAQLPEDTILLAKEHPASIGCLDQDRLEKVLQHRQFRLLHPKINSYDVLEKCLGVLTINSKVGAEAVSMGFPVISFGKAFYTEDSYTQKFTNWPQLGETIKTWTRESRNPQSEAQKNWRHFLGQVFLDSFEVELYDVRPQNVQTFAKILTTLA